MKGKNWNIKKYNLFLDEDGYPTKEALKRIEKWDVPKRTEKLIEFIENLWQFGDWGFKYKGRKLELHTGGWSGNEDIIRALEKNSFWLFFWEKTVRGGHYYFEVKKFGENK